MKRKHYENLDKNATTSSFKDSMRWQKERRGKRKDLSFQIPISEKVDIDFLTSNRSIPTITWIGHSTFLIQLNGLNIITDPVWAKQLGTYRRLTPAGIPIDKLPLIDIVLISHSHYDHLNYRSIKRLKGDPLFLVPSGLARIFKRKGYAKTLEFNWWDNHQFKGLNISFVPAQHWTKRTLTDTNRSHWGGWVIEDRASTIYFAGDSGYFSGFKQIGARYNIDYCLMPIGAYEPEWFMATQHVSPEDAIQAFLDTDSKTMIPMHYGAYMLADDTPKEALDRLHSEWQKRALENDRLHVLQIGETIRVVS